MVPENEFHHKDPPARSATPATVQNGPGTAAQPAAATTNAAKADESTNEDTGEKNNFKYF